MITKKQFLEAHLEKVQAAIYQNETFIKYNESGAGHANEEEVAKAKVAVENDKKWFEFLQKEYETES